MTLLQSILLGILQGLTEFLPISSSGHLVLIPHLLGWNIYPEDAYLFDVLVQVATLAAVFAYFWKDLWQIGNAFARGLVARQPFQGHAAALGWYLILATIPAGLLGLLLKDAVETAFSSPRAAGGFLLITAVLLIAAERIGTRNRTFEELTWRDTLWMGFAQALAIFPGVSRSGATITGGMTRNLNRQSAARFSFLMSIPIMLAAGLLASLDLLQTPNLSSRLLVYLPGFAAAAITGYLSIRWLLGYLTRRPLYGFAIYCIVLGIIGLLVG
ncbi:MAG: undecaprenyl-diphosphate phosphatase [Anaerolineales bacterium]